MRSRFCRVVCALALLAHRIAPNRNFRVPMARGTCRLISAAFVASTPASFWRTFDRQFRVGFLLVAARTKCSPFRCKTCTDRGVLTSGHFQSLESRRPVKLHPLLTAFRHLHPLRHTRPPTYHPSQKCPLVNTPRPVQVLHRKGEHFARAATSKKPPSTRRVHPV